MSRNKSQTAAALKRNAGSLATARRMVEKFRAEQMDLIVEAREVHSMTYPEIAEFTGLKATAVATMMFRHN
jgi:hypothetical protein